MFHNFVSECSEDMMSGRSIDAESIMVPLEESFLAVFYENLLAESDADASSRHSGVVKNAHPKFADVYRAVLHYAQKAGDMLDQGMIKMSDLKKILGPDMAPSIQQCVSALNKANQAVEKFRDNDLLAIGETGIKRGMSRHDATQTTRIVPPKVSAKQPAQPASQAPRSKVPTPVAAESVLVEKKGVSYKFANTQLAIPERWAKKFLAWGNREIPEESLYIDDEDGSFGREDDIHVTVLYGIDVDDGLEQVRELIEDEEEFEIEIGNVSIFSGKESGKERPYDVVKFEVNSPTLQKLHKKIKKNVSNQYSWPTYKPHLTIAYVKEGDGDRYAGKVKGLTGEKISIASLVYSGTDGRRARMSFKKKKKT